MPCSQTPGCITCLPVLREDGSAIQLSKKTHLTRHQTSQSDTDFQSCEGNGSHHLQGSSHVTTGMLRPITWHNYMY